MIPIVVDPKAAGMALIGRGRMAQKRLAWLIEGGAEDVAVFSDRPEPEFEKAAGARLRRHLPSAAELAAFRIVWIADLPQERALRMARLIRAQGSLVNVEDVREGCDFHNPALVRRGDLLLTVSTNGKSPGLAVRIKRQLAAAFGPNWGERLETIGQKRSAWRRRERDLDQLADLTDAVIDSKGWLDQETHPERRLGT